MARRTRNHVHPAVPELAEDLRRGKLTRREFLRTVTLLGVSAGAAYTMASKITGEPLPGLMREANAATPKMGGTLRCSMQVQEMTDPATFDWTQKSNVSRQIVEYLTITGPDNITRPYLAEKWEASDDLKVWTLHLRKGVKWSNGEDFNATDVVFNFHRWLNPKTGSSNIGLFSGLTDEIDTGKKDEAGNPVMEKRMREGAVEKVDDHTVRLHLKAPELAIPENLYNYPTAIVNRHFEEEGGDLSKNPVGTGPYTLGEFRVGEVAKLKRAAGKYWGDEPYLAEIHYFDHGEDPSAAVAALASNQVDMVYEIPFDVIDVVENLPNAVVNRARTAQTAVARMQVDQKPFTNLKLRQAVAACMDAKKILEVAYRGLGDIGEDHHVAPIHPEYYKLAPLKPDIARAKKLLAEAGYKDGIKLKVDIGNATGKWELHSMEAFKEQLAPAGIDLELNVMPSAQYWDLWTKTPFGLTAWTHRPLGVMVLNLGYRTGVPWNESHYANPEFDKALDHANGILDVDERRKAMEKVETILQNDAVIVQPLWRNVFSPTNKNVHGYEVHPTFYHQFNKVWVG